MDATDAGLAWEILQRYTDPATAEFDAVLASADVPDDIKRALRFWQRESVANVKQYASEALPTVFAALYAAQHDAATATRTAGAALGAQVPVDASVSLLEERRRTVAARLVELG